MKEHDNYAAKTVILLVDDDANVLKAVSRLLYDMDYDVLTATSGDAGLELLRNNSTVHVVVSDYLMPGMNGMDFLRKVAELYPDCVRIIMTAHSETKIVVPAINEGLLYRFLLKPWDDDELKTAIAAAHERYRLIMLNRQLYRDLQVSNNELRELNEHLDEIVKQRTADLQKFATAINTSSDWVLVTDINGVITFANEAVSTLSGFNKSEILGSKASLWKSGKHDEDFYANVWNTITAGQAFRGVFINKKKDGSFFLLDNTISPVKDEHGAIRAFVSTGKDLTHQRHLEERLSYMAYYDPVTDMPNKTLFVDRLEMALARSRHKGRLVSIMIAGIDNFGQIVDTWGHAYSDNILINLSQRLQSAVRDGDTVARIGTHDFGIIFNDIADEGDIVSMLDRVFAAIGPSISLGNEEVRITASIGISLSPNDATSSQELIRNASLSQAQARNDSGNSYRFYTPQMNEKVLEFKLMERMLTKAINLGGFILHYQPYWDIATGAIRGAEALIRLKAENGALILPGRFIHVLEETGLIYEAGDWVLNEVLRQLKSWQSKGNRLVPVTVNLSGVQFKQKDLIKKIGHTIMESGIAPNLLSFELTESALMQDRAFSISAIRTLKSLGIRILIDDFGTAYSSLSYLSSFDVDGLKIDMSFIKKITMNPTDHAIVKAIVSMAHSLGMTVIAEGVETDDQLQLLREMGCDMIQGFLFSRPIAPNELAERFL